MHGCYISLRYASTWSRPLAGEKRAAREDQAVTRTPFASGQGCAFEHAGKLKDVAGNLHARLEQLPMTCLGMARPHPRR